MLFSLLALCAFGNTWSPWNGGFLSAARDDAPPDGVVLYAANYEVSVLATDSDGGVVALASTLVTGVGSPSPTVAIHPPTGGWLEGETYALSSADPYEPTEVASLTITGGTEVASWPPYPVVGVPVLGEWVEDSTYPWGCCEAARTVEIPVRFGGGDPWAWVELVGDFNLGIPSQVTIDEHNSHLDVGLGGAGEQTLSFVQWVDERGAQPPCVDIVAMSAAGLPGARERLCLDDDLPSEAPATSEEPTPTPAAAHCATTPGGAVPWIAWLPGLARRRRPR